jgi:hypothetical protein
MYVHTTKPIQGTPHQTHHDIAQPPKEGAGERRGESEAAHQQPGVEPNIAAHVERVPHPGDGVGGNCVLHDGVGDDGHIHAEELGGWWCVVGVVGSQPVERVRLSQDHGAQSFGNSVRAHLSIEIQQLILILMLMLIESATFHPYLGPAMHVLIVLLPLN